MKLQVRSAEKLFEVEVQEDSAGQFHMIVMDPAGEKRDIAVRVIEQAGGRLLFQMDQTVQDVLISGGNGEITIEHESRTRELRVLSPKDRLSVDGAATEEAGRVAVKAPMPGTVVTVLASEGQSVTKGDGLVVVESMKMQNEIRSPKNGTIVSCRVEDGQSVNGGQLLFEVE